MSERLPRYAQTVFAQAVQTARETGASVDFAVGQITVTIRPPAPQAGQNPADLVDP
jgi:hypothetical protein